MSEAIATEPLGNSPESRDEAGTLTSQSSTSTQTEAETAPKDGQPETSSQKTETSTKSEAEGAPEAYADFKVPEGYELDAEVAKEAGAIFKSLNLPQDAAQKLVDFYVAKTNDSAQAPIKAYEEIRGQWRKEVVEDPALGNGQDLKPEAKAQIGRFYNAIGAETAAAFKEAMELTGAGDNPAVVRALVAAAKLMTEGTFVRPGGPVTQTAPAGGRPSAAQALFPKLPSSA